MLREHLYAYAYAVNINEFWAFTLQIDSQIYLAFSGKAQLNAKNSNGFRVHLDCDPWEKESSRNPARRSSFVFESQSSSLKPSPPSTLHPLKDGSNHISMR